MGNRADAAGTDVEIYHKALSNTVHADTRTGAPEELLALLDQLGLERRTVKTAGPAYTWHEAPAHLDEGGQKELASRAVPALFLAGFDAGITPDVFDAAAYREAMDQVVRQVRELGPAPGTRSGVKPAPATPGSTAPSAPRRAL
ncbi:hypothetical protein ACIBK8_25685 [Streptomyces sp. NPDC050161]|uniref:hypothetical protein n=1 Tax=Streptomyces sp. NPDC050161 TaxID=3365604 RepID=UPI0037B56163